jgi:hypothetical protein
MKERTRIFFLFVMMALFFAPAVAAEEGDEDWEIIPGVEGEKALNLGSGVLATVLFVLTAVAYARTKSSRLLFVAAAFLLFAVKGYITSMELFFGEWSWVDPVSAALDFFILLSFFIGLLKR